MVASAISNRKTRAWFTNLSLRTSTQPSLAPTMHPLRNLEMILYRPLTIYVITLRPGLKGSSGMFPACYLGLRAPSRNARGAFTFGRESDGDVLSPLQRYANGSERGTCIL